MNLTTITRKEFEAWLESKDSSAPVGKVGYGQECPVAKFLKETGVAKKIAVSNSVTYDFESQHYVVNPSWMEKFVGQVDAHKMGQMMTAAQCLKLIRFY